jgi:hypothetical protein
MSLGNASDYGSYDSLNSFDVQSDDENDRTIAERRLSPAHPTTPVTSNAVVRPQFSCPDFAMERARLRKLQMRDAPPLPAGPHKAPKSPPGPQKKPSLGDCNKRTWEDSFGKEHGHSQKRHRIYFTGIRG